MRGISTGGWGISVSRSGENYLSAVNATPPGAAAPCRCFSQTKQSLSEDTMAKSSQTSKRPVDRETGCSPRAVLTSSEVREVERNFGELLTEDPRGSDPSAMCGEHHPNQR